MHTPSNIHIDTSSIIYRDPIVDKFNELEERLRTLETKFEIIDVTKEHTADGPKVVW